MDIIYTLSDMQFDAKTIDELYEKIVEYFTLDGISADVKINGDTVHVHFSEADFYEAQKEFEKIASLCSNRKLNEAKPLLDKFIAKHPRHSEAYRIKAQILREDGQAEDALDTCLDALRCDPRNIWALMLMGNMLNQDHHNLDAAQSYYDKVLEYYPNNMIAINNIAAVNAERGNNDKAIELFKKAIELDKTYENAYYGLANVYYLQNNFREAFEVAREGCVTGVRRPENPQVSEELRKVMLASAQAVDEEYDFENVAFGIKDILEDEYKVEIRTESDETLQVYAQMQYGPIRGRRWNLLRYNPKRPFIPHLMAHELTHLEMILEDNKNGNGASVVYSNNKNEIAFRSSYNAWQKKLIDKIGHTKAIDVVSQVHNGLMLQIMNCPLDLFVEQRIFDQYDSMRPIQLLSLLAQEQDNIKAIEGSMKASFIPASILRASKIMNIVTSMHFEHLFGIRLYQYYKPTKEEFEVAKDLYEEYQAYSDITPGEEYDLITYFAQTFDFEDYLTISPEADYIKDNVKSAESESIFDDILNSKPSDVDGNSFEGLSQNQKERQDRFYEQHKDGEDQTLTMMMAMYMLSALRLFSHREKHLIRQVAFEIAMIGTTGIDPKREDYVVKSLDDKKMGGYQLLAYYYVSWKLFNPELHKTLNLPFDNAYATALQMFNAGKKE